MPCLLSDYMSVSKQTLKDQVIICGLIEKFKLDKVEKKLKCLIFTATTMKEFNAIPVSSKIISITSNFKEII